MSFEDSAVIQFVINVHEPGDGFGFEDLNNGRRGYFWRQVIVSGE